MGYELHITRAKEWSDNSDCEIGADEWLKLVEEDPELRLAGENGPYFALWNGPPSYPDAWLDWCGGYISTKSPDEALIAKMVQIATKLNAKVQGDDGEIYAGENHLNQLMWSLQALAAPAEFQLELPQRGRSIPSQLWLEFERACDEIFDSEGRGPTNLLEKGLEGVGDLRCQLQLMREKGNERLWVNETLATESEWEAIRKASRRVIKAFGWPNEPPPKGWSD